MTEKAEKTIEIICNNVNKMNDSQKQYFLGFAQGMASVIANQKPDSQLKSEENTNK